MNETLVKLLLERGYTRARRERKKKRKEMGVSLLQTSLLGRVKGYGNKEEIGIDSYYG